VTLTVRKAEMVRSLAGYHFQSSCEFQGEAYARSTNKTLQMFAKPNSQSGRILENYRPMRLS
jgi:hypothetical protein